MNNYSEKYVAIIASAVTDIPLYPEAAWFQKPSTIPTDKHLTIQADGRVYGYIALWDSCHVGLDGCVKPPKGSPTDFDYAHIGETITASGDTIKTAVIAGGIPHPPASGIPNDSIPDLYANTGRQLMRVRYGDDDTGLWFAGALFPDVSVNEVAHIRASALSGDWRWHLQHREETNGAYDFSGAILVNVPGFRIGNDNMRSGKSVSIMASSETTETVDAVTDGGGCGCGGGKETIAERNLTDADIAALVTALTASATITAQADEEMEVVNADDAEAAVEAAADTEGAVTLESLMAGIEAIREDILMLTDALVYGPQVEALSEEMVSE